MGQLADKIRAKYPGAYDDMDDATLEQKIVAKYPQYADLAGPAKSAPSAATGTISAQPTGVGHYLEKVENDIRYGGDSTIVGSVLKKLGAPGINMGVPEGAQQLATPITGPLHVAQGIAEGKPGKVISGALETATLPGAFVAPEAGEAASTAAAKMTSASARKQMLSDSVTATLNKIVEKEGLKPIEAKTASEAVSNLAEQFQTRAKAAYRAVDQAVGGELQPVLDKIQQYGRAIKANRALDPEKADAMLEARDKLIALKNQLVQKAADSGIPDAQNLISVADSDYSRYKALSEHVGKKIARAAGEAGGNPKPGSFSTAVKNLDIPRAGRKVSELEKGLGPEGAADMKEAAKQAVKTEERVKRAHKALKGAGAAGLAAAGGYEAKRVLSGSDE